MGFVKSTSSTRCRYASCFILGFVVASLVLAAMFWIIWCYLGLTIVQISDSQRRAVVDYSYTTLKSSTTSSPINRTVVGGAIESSVNSISNSAVTPSSQPRKKDSPADLAKGDFAARPPGGASLNSTRRDFIAPSLTSPPHERKSSILVREKENSLNIRKISISNTESRSQPDNLPERDIKPTQTYAPAQSDPFPEDRDERIPISRGANRRDEIESSRPAYRDPDFEREPPRRSKPEIRKYDDEDDYDGRGSRSRYDRRDRGRDGDDRYSKGDTRVYPDDKQRSDDRYPARDSDKRRGDDIDRDDRYRTRDDRDREDRYRGIDDGYRGDPYRARDDRYRDDDRYEIRDRYKDDVYRENRRRDDRYDDKYRPREDRYDDKYRPREDRYDDKYRPREDRYDDKYRPREDRYDDRYSSTDDRRSAYDDRKDRYIPRDDEDRYIGSEDRDFRSPIMSSGVDIPLDRKSGRPGDSRRSTDYDRPIRDRPRSSYIDESRTDGRYSDQEDYFRGSSRYDDRDKIYPSSMKDEAYISHSTASMTRSRGDDRYTKYDGDDRRTETSRFISPSSTRQIDSTRRDIGRDGQDYGGLERRSSSSEEEYRRENSRTKYYDDADKKSYENSRPDYRGDDYYTRHTRTDDDEYRRHRRRGDPDKYDRSIKDDDRLSSRYDGPRRSSDADTGLRKESRRRDVKEDRASLYPVPPEKDRRYSDDPPRRQLSDDMPSRHRPDTMDDRPLRPTVERTLEDRRPYREDTYKDDDRDDSLRYNPLTSGKRDPFVSSHTSPRDTVVQDKGRHSSESRFDDYSKERPINAKDVIEAALKHSDAPNQSPQKVSYPVFDPRVLNLTSTDIIPPGDRRGTTIMSRRRRNSINLPYSSILQRNDAHEKMSLRKKRD